jgi:hypothetical protein
MNVLYMKQPLETFISKWVEIAHMHRPPLQKLEDAKLTATQHLCVVDMNFQRNPNKFFFPITSLMSLHVTMRFDMVTFVVVG